MKNKTTPQNPYEDLFNYLKELSIHELIEEFNREVFIKSWTSSRSAFLMALRDALELHPYFLDPEVFQYGTTSFAQKIELRGGTITSIKN